MQFHITVHVDSMIQDCWSIAVCCSVSDKLLIDKNPVISFHVVEDGIRPPDEADGNLVIDTSEGHQVQME